MKTYLAPKPQSPDSTRRYEVPELALRLAEVETTARPSREASAMVMYVQDDRKWIDRKTEHFKQPRVLH